MAQRAVRAGPDFPALVLGRFQVIVIRMSSQADFLHFYRQAEPDLRAFIGSVIRDPHGREDVLQEVSRTLWQKFDEFDLTRTFGAWARGIAGRKMLETGRRNARFPLVFAPETVALLMEAFDETDEHAAAQEAALKLCMESLPERPRRILAARYEERWPCERIGQELGLKVKAVHQVLSRLRKALRHCITARIEADDFRPAPFAAGQPGGACDEESEEGRAGIDGDPVSLVSALAARLLPPAAVSLSPAAAAAGVAASNNDFTESRFLNHNR